MATFKIETRSENIAEIAADLEFVGRLYIAGGFDEAREKIVRIRSALDRLDYLIVDEQCRGKEETCARRLQ